MGWSRGRGGAWTPVPAGPGVGLLIPHPYFPFMETTAQSSRPYCSLRLLLLVLVP